MKILAVCAIIIGFAQGENICPAMKVVVLTDKYKKIWKANEVIENTKFVAPPGLDRVLQITGDNVTLRNVIIHHSASGIGIYGFRANGLKLENVEIISYGNDFGPNPCPLERPRAGYECSNIKLVKSERVVIKNVRVNGGSAGIQV